MNAMKSLPAILGIPTTPTPPPTSLLGRMVCYHVAQTTQICRSCRSYHSSVHVSLEVIGPRFRQFRQVSRIEYNLPILSHSQPSEFIPLCPHCAPTASLAHLPAAPEPATLPTPRAGWRSAPDAPAPVKAKSIGKKTYTVDDL